MSTELVATHGRVLRCVIATDANGGTLDRDGMRQTVAALRDVSGLGCVVLTSTGRNFCTGGDVHEFAAEDPHAAVAAMAAQFHALVRALAACPLPVVIGVRGWAAGAGMSLACSGDVVIGGPSTRFRVAYPAIGFSADGGMSWLLPRLVGPALARDLMLTNRVLDGTAAHAAGLLSRLVDDERIDVETADVAASLADGPTAAYGRIKALLAASPGARFDDQLDAEAEAIAACADGPEGRAGVDAFLAKRTPRFHGEP